MQHNAKWVFGAYSDEVGANGDCSAKVTAILRRSGRYDLTRCRARDMHEGLCGWEGDMQYLEEAIACSIAFFDMNDTDTIDHTGILTRDTFMKYINMLAHASKKHGFIQIPIEKEKKDYFYTRFRGAKNLKSSGQFQKKVR